MADTIDSAETTAIESTTAKPKKGWLSARALLGAAALLGALGLIFFKWDDLSSYLKKKERDRVVVAPGPEPDKPAQADLPPPAPPAAPAPVATPRKGGGRQAKSYLLSSAEAKKVERAAYERAKEDFLAIPD